MKKGVFIFGVALLGCIRSAPTTLQTVWLKDVTTIISSEKRTFSDLDHPDELTFNLKIGSGDLTLNLKRNFDIDPNADIYFARTSKDGRSVLVKTPNYGKKDVAYYQDMEKGAFMTVRCVKRSNEQCDREINGNIQIGDSSYDLRPAETEVTSRNLLEVPGLFAKRYILQNQAYIQRENSVENTDRGKDNEKKVEEELTALFRTFEGQHKGTHVSPSNATLSSRNTIAVHNIEARDKSRQLKQVYYVKVAVLIDSSIWDLFSSIVASRNPLTSSRKVKTQIKEYYSHIMNGVNMRYKGIPHRSISISVILSKFIYFKRRSDFPHKQSNVAEGKGKSYIEDTKYIKDLSLWDEAIGKTYEPSYDHAMLFTRHFLYHEFLDDTSEGIAYEKEICNVGKRLSLIRTSDYFTTSQSAAHELGHNLGASHDGEKDAIACKAEDSFIMTPQMPGADPGTPISGNAWKFSWCSVEAFKRNLNDKDCVRHPGPFYNEQEYMQYVMKQPGEAYTPNDQCQINSGPGSIYCGPKPLSSCYLKCTDPKTRRCMERFYFAARGTQCGHNRTYRPYTQPCMKPDALQDLHVVY